MKRENAVALMDAFDVLDSAAQRILTAQPAQMTESGERLDKARLDARKILQRVVMESLS